MRSLCFVLLFMSAVAAIAAADFGSSTTEGVSDVEYGWIAIGPWTVGPDTLVIDTIYGNFGHNNDGDDTLRPVIYSNFNGVDSATSLYWDGAGYEIVVTGYVLTEYKVPVNQACSLIAGVTYWAGWANMTHNGKCDYGKAAYQPKNLFWRDTTYATVIPDPFTDGTKIQKYTIKPPRFYATGTGLGGPKNATRRRRVQIGGP